MHLRDDGAAEAKNKDAEDREVLGT